MLENPAFGRVLLLPMHTNRLNQYPKPSTIPSNSTILTYLVKAPCRLSPVKAGLAPRAFAATTVVADAKAIPVQWDILQ